MSNTLPSSARACNCRCHAMRLPRSTERTSQRRGFGLCEISGFISSDTNAMTASSTYPSMRVAAPQHCSMRFRCRVCARERARIVVPKPPILCRCENMVDDCAKACDATMPQFPGIEPSEYARSARIPSASRCLSESSSGDSSLRIARVWLSRCLRAVAKAPEASAIAAATAAVR